MTADTGECTPMKSKTGFRSKPFKPQKAFVQPLRSLHISVFIGGSCASYSQSTNFNP